jgi:hypothetical protein
MSKQCRAAREGVAAYAEGQERSQAERQRDVQLDANIALSRRVPDVFSVGASVVSCCLHAQKMLVIPWRSDQRYFERERVRRVQARASSRRATQRAELAKAWGPNDPVLCRFQNPSPPIDRQNPPPILSPATASNLDAHVGTRASRHIARLHLTGTRLSSAQTRVRRLRQ